jgi:ABC-type dipeptide/oligopeptide/nickel transport system permease component
MAVLVARIGPATAGLVVPTLVLALGLLAAPTHQVRSALIGALGEDHVRATMARGASPIGVARRHALRPALVPLVTLAALEPPLALGGAFVIERVFQLEGLGEATLRAVETHDVAWLMAISLILAAVAAVGVIATDLAHVALDPRVGPALLGRRRP